LKNKTLKAKNNSKGRNNQKNGNREVKSSRTLLLFSVVMLLLMALSSFGRIAVASHSTSRGGQTPTQPGSLTSGVATAARVLVFHREDKSSILCEDLVITAAGDAVYSTCGNGVAKQYALSETEQQQLQSWIKKFQAVYYDHNAAPQADGKVAQLYLNGQGSQLATEVETRRMIDFATALGVKIASQS